MRPRALLWWLGALFFPVACTALADNALSDKPSENDSLGGAGPTGGDGGTTTSGAGGDPGAEIGEACQEAAQCLSGHCSDGVCCNDACIGPCVACDLFETEGTCLPHPAGTDPDGDCDPGEVCSTSATCISVEGGSCSADPQCTSMHCVEGVCCDALCDGLCESCLAEKNGVIDGLCLSIIQGDDPDNECTGTECFAAGACCGDAQPPVGGACPPLCSNCNNDVCTIECTDAFPCPTTITCPAGFDCVVDCVDADSCKDKVIDCPAEHTCEVDCRSSNHRCQNAEINCSNGPCIVTCVSGDTCDGADVYCGTNSCDVTCVAGGKPAVDCGDSCECTTTGC